jgi:hypothetical protein
MSTIFGFILGHKYEKADSKGKRKIIAWIIIVILILIALMEFFVQELLLVGLSSLLSGILYIKYIKE